MPMLAIDDLTVAKMGRKARIVTIGIFAAWSLAVAPALRAQPATSLARTYRVVDLGVLPGGADTSYARAVNDAGQVIGQSSSADNAGCACAGFVWDTTNGMLDVGRITGNATWLTGINNHGVVVGYSGDSYWGWFEAARWDSINGLQPLGFGAIAGYPYYTADAINDAGAITYENHSFSGPPSKAYFISGGAATWIGELNSGAYTWPNAVNNNNEVAGGCSSQAFIWKSDQGMVGLGFLPGCNMSIANGINDASQVVGYCAKADGTQTAFIWTSSTGMSQLGSSGIGGSNFTASAISAGGIVIGNCQIAETDHAIAWTPGQNAVDLNSLVSNLSGWVCLQSANGINSSGVIVGSGLRTNGVTHAFILYPLSVIVIAPSITHQPVSGAVSSGAATTLTVAVDGTAPYTYQWLFSGTNLAESSRITGTTTSNLNISAFQAGDAGAYQVIVSNASGSVTSLVARLTVKSGDTWTITGSMSTGRDGQTMTLLPNGEVLVAGGASGPSGWLSSAELYHPASGTWTMISDMTMPRQWHSATLLANGKVLVAGGTPGGYWSSSAELYDPATGTWTAIAAMKSARGSHTATLLPSGKVLVTGGAGPGNPIIASAELYDPATGAWAWTGSMSAARYYHTATLLPNGKVLVVGGASNGATLSSAELYDPTTGTWTTAGAMTALYEGITATLLPNGKVLVAGGLDSSGAFSTATELYDPATGTWRTTGLLWNIQWVSTASLLPSGKVLATGYGGASGFNSQTYDPATESWMPTFAMNIDRSGQSVTLLPNGTVLAAGGNFLSSAELYSYPIAPSITNQPASGTVASGGTATLTVGVAGTSPFSYQWRFNGVNIDGATNVSLSITNFCVANAGGYSVTVSNSAGGVISRIATFTTVDIAMFAGVIVNGPIGSNYLIQAVSSLSGTNWRSLTNVALPTQPYIYIDYSTPTNTKQFYRAIPQ